MVERSRRSRKSSTRSSAPTGGSNSPRRGMHRGTEGRERAEHEQEANEARREARRKEMSGPLRLYLKPGEEREIIIVDEAPDFYMYEHQIYNGKGSNPRYTHTGCVKEYETCPACEADQDSSYNLYLTVIDLDEYTNKAGEVVEFSKKLMVVKSGQQRKFLRRYNRTKDEGGLRGQVVILSRGNDKDPVIGSDIDWDDRIGEEELVGAYIREWTDREKKSHTENCGEVYNYEELFEEATVDGILQALGGKGEAPAGSRKQASQAAEEESDNSGGDGWDKNDDPDDVPFDEGEEVEGEENEDGKGNDDEPTRPARSRSSRSRSQTDDKPSGSEGRRRRRSL